MSSETLFYIIIGILVFNFVFDKILDTVNAKKFEDPIPNELSDVYDPEEYKKSQAYKKEKHRFGTLTSWVSIVATLLFFFLDGFAYIDGTARSVSENNILIALIFFGIIMGASSLLGTPFSYYSTFVIEEKYNPPPPPPK